MRKILIGLTLFILLVIALVAFAVSNVNGLLEENRETLAGLASDAAGREVSFESAEVAFSKGLAVRVAGLRVAEDPRFGKDDFLTLENAFVGIEILPALRRRIEVSGVRLDQPTIRLIQTSRGYNFASLGATSDPAASEAPADPDAQESPLAVAIAGLEISDGTLYYEDRTSPDGLSLVISELESTGTELTLDGPIAIDFSGLVRSRRPVAAGLESRLEGALRLDGIATMAGTLHLESPRMHPALLGIVLDEGGEPEKLDDLEVDVVLAADPDKAGIPVRARSQASRLGGFDLSSIDLDLVYRTAGRAPKVEIAKLDVGVAGGTIDLEGDIVLGEPGRSPFAIESQLRDLDSGELATVLLDVPPGMLTGRLAGDVALRGDSLEWESLKRSLAGSLRLELGEGALEQVNVLNTLVNRLLADPGLGQLAANSLREVAPRSLQGDRTPFEGVDMALELINGAIRADKLEMKAGDFALQAAGTLGLDGKVAADGTIRFSEELSRKILAKADEFAPILGQDGIVVLPLRVSGMASSPTLAPDLAAMTQKATAEAKQELTDRAAKELGDALFGKKKEDEDPAREAERSSTEDMVREGLGRLLGR